MDVGFPTVLALAGQKLAPGIADRYLAATGYESQQAEDAVLPDRADNLFTPVPGNYGAHGRFSAEARRSSAQFWVNRNLSLLGLAAGAATAFGLIAFGGGLNRRG